MNVYVVNIFEKETDLLAGTKIFLTWRSAHKYYTKNLMKWLKEGYYANCGGEPICFRCPKED